MLAVSRVLDTNINLRPLAGLLFLHIYGAPKLTNQAKRNKTFNFPTSSLFVRGVVQESLNCSSQ